LTANNGALPALSGGLFWRGAPYCSHCASPVGLHTSRPALTFPGSFFLEPSDNLHEGDFRSLFRLEFALNTLPGKPL
jgi:hypothetical protein